MKTQNPTEINHTPGPWMFRADIETHVEGRPYFDVRQRDEFGSCRVALVCSEAWMPLETSHGVDRAEMRGESNARLIATAPKLLEACKAALALLPSGECSEQDAANALLNAAIAEATAKD
jgi:hypothetical protein